MPASQPPSSSGPPTSAATPSPPKPPSPTGTAVVSSQAAATPTPTVKLNPPLPTASIVNSNNVSPSVLTTATLSSSVTQIRMLASPSPSVTYSNTGKNLSAQTGLRESPNAKSSSAAANPPANSSNTIVIVAIVLSVAALLLCAIVVTKFFCARSRKKKSPQRFQDTFMVVSSALPAQPTNQSHGGVGESPATVIFSKSASASASPSEPMKYQRQSSLVYSNDYVVGHQTHTRQSSNLSMAEYIQHGHQFPNSKTWDGSRTTPGLMWR